MTDDLEQDAGCSGKAILPGSTIGIFGSGQLGKMMAIAAKYMGYRVCVFSPDSDTPAGQVADVEISASYDDIAAVKQFAQQVDVVTLEFENIPVAALDAAAEHVNVYPGQSALATTQDRSLEKQFLRDNGIPTCQFEVIRSLDELQSACQTIMPGIVKTTRGGYDGKGQFVIRSEADIAVAWETLSADEVILESFVPFDFEFSVIGARSANGEFAAFDSIRNDHHNQILDVSTSPSGIGSALEQQGAAIVQTVMEQLNAVGVLCVEFFYADGQILVNEIAPRPHNSGHLTIEAHATSQFEQHIRAVCGLPLGSTRQLTPAAMANLLGDAFVDAEPRSEECLSRKGVSLHWYCKKKFVAARKMGHLTVVSETADQAKAEAIAARAAMG